MDCQQINNRTVLEQKLSRLLCSAKLLSGASWPLLGRRSLLLLPLAPRTLLLQVQWTLFTYLPWMLQALYTIANIQRHGLLQLLLPCLLGVATWCWPSPPSAYHEEHKGWRQHGQVKSCLHWFEYQSLRPLLLHILEYCLLALDLYGTGCTIGSKFTFKPSEIIFQVSSWILIRPVEPVMGMFSTPVYWSPSLKNNLKCVKTNIWVPLRCWLFPTGQKNLYNIIQFMQYPWNAFQHEDSSTNAEHFVQSLNQVANECDQLKCRLF